VDPAAYRIKQRLSDRRRVHLASRLKASGALAHAGVKASDLDLIVLATATPDETFRHRDPRAGSLGMTMARP
jgi:3-oxoacyl-[acyl-carrier-protein] synthase III